MKKGTIAAVVGVGAIGVAAFMLTRNSSNSQQKQQSSSAFSGYSGGGATGGYSEPTVAQTVSSVLESVLNQTTQSPALPEMTADMNPSDEAADVAQSSYVSSDVQRVFASGGTSMVQQLTDMGYKLPYQSNSGAAATLGGQTSNAGAALMKAVEYEENQ